MRLLLALLGGVAAAAVGAVSGAAGTVLHLRWWGLALALLVLGIAALLKYLRGPS